MLQNLPIIMFPPTFGAGYCPSPQQLANDIASGLRAYVAGGYMFFNYGSTTPIPDDQNKPWLRLNNDGTPDRWYVFANGSWIWPHPTPAGSSERRMWVGLETDLVVYDGGSAGVVTATTGPMWEVDHDFDARFPIGPGTLPSGTAIAVSGTGGEEKHVLTVAEMPPHTHNTGAYAPDKFPNSGGSEVQPILRQIGGGPATATSSTGGNAGVTEGQNNIPPYRGVFMIKRTARIFFSV